MIDTTRIRPPMTTYQVTRYAEIVAAAFQVRAESILGVHRGNQSIARARQALYALLYEQTNASLNDIGKRFQRDHTTILHGIQQVRSWKEFAPAYYAAYERATREVLV